VALSSCVAKKLKCPFFPSFMGLPTWVSPLDFTPTASHSLWISGTMTEGDRLMDWKTLLACITGSVEEQLLLRNEYVIEENQQNPRNSRRNTLPTERIDWPL
jgi:hypothetical protein